MNMGKSGEGAKARGTATYKGAWGAGNNQAGLSVASQGVLK